MTAVLASYVKMSTLVDGTMRVVLDIEPSAAADAFRLLGSPGTPIALARITNEAAQKAAQAPAERKLLTLPQKVALTCREQSFLRFVGEFSGIRNCDERQAASFVRSFCGVSSRAEITEGSKAERRWQRIEADYLDWQREAA